MLAIGIDVGATSIKLGLVEKNKILYKTSIPTKKGNKNLVTSLVNLVRETLTKNNLPLSNIQGIGIGIPGSVRESGFINFATNLKVKNLDLVAELKQHFDTNIKVTNDASAACLCEYVYGKYSCVKNMAYVTLGSGIGLGLIINGKLFGGPNGGDTEIGHIVVDKNGERCTCGNKGCLETYVSKNALINSVKTFSKQSQQSKFYNVEEFEVKDIFDNYPTDPAAKQAVSQYLEYLCIGINNICNIIRPEVVVLGGAIAKQGKVLTTPIQQYLNTNLYGKYPKVKVATSTHKNNSGILGAATLCCEE